MKCHHKSKKLLIAVALLSAASSSLPTAEAGSRDAVQKALAATVAVEWRATEQANARSGGGNANQNAQHFIESVETDVTGTQRRKTSVVNAPPIALPPLNVTFASGTVISPDGVVVTLSRDEGEGQYTVYLEDGRGLPARMLVDDSRNGLRLLKVDADDLPTLTPAENVPELGDQVYAAFATATYRDARSAAQGIVAARQGTPGDLLRLDLTAGRMSTGGPLVDDEGRLVGILAGKSASSPADDLYSTAIPLDAIRALLKARQGENTVVIQRGILGIQLNSESDGEQRRVVVQVMEGTPAQAAGVRDGDQLLAIDGQEVSSPEKAVALVSRHALGEKVSVTLQRDGEEKTLEIAIGRMPEQPPAPPAPGSAQPPLPDVGYRVVHPERLYVFTEDGKRVAVRATPEQLAPLRALYKARVGQQTTTGDKEGATVLGEQADVIRVERSDLEKKLEEVGRNVASLHEQIGALTEEIKSLRAKLGENE